MDFTIERIKLLADSSPDNLDLVAEFAFLYDREVKENREEPIKHLAILLDFSFEKTGEFIATAVAVGYLVRNKKEWKISQTALRKLRLKGNQKV